MRYIFRNKQFFSMVIFLIIIAIIFTLSINGSFLQSYITNYTSIPIRYFFIIISVVIEYFICSIFYSSTIITRLKYKSNLLAKSFFIEVLLFFFAILIFNFIIFMFNIDDFFVNIFYVLMTCINLLIIYVFISLIIKVIDIFISKHFLASIGFVFVFTCFDLVLDHFNFFFFNNSLINLNYIYTIFFFSKKWFVWFVALILLSILLYNILALTFYKKDFLLQKEDDNE